MLLFLKLLFAHILGDFVFQPDSWVKDKETNKIASLKLYFHIAIHAFLILTIVGFNIKEYGFSILTVVLTHYIIDLAKLYFQNKKTKRTWFFVDQFAHICVLIGVTLFTENIRFTITNLITKETLLLLISFFTITHVSAVIIKIIITKWNPESKKENDDSLAKAGRYIGVLERLFVFIFIITNHWEAIGFLLAAKSVFRFGDLTAAKDRKLTEYILIGTLLSFGLAIAIGILYSYVLNLL